MICGRTGKRCQSRADAVRTVAQMARDWPHHRLTPSDHKDVRAYRCDHCQRWHVGHQFSSVRRHRSMSEKTVELKGVMVSEGQLREALYRLSKLPDPPKFKAGDIVRLKNPSTFCFFSGCVVGIVVDSHMSQALESKYGTKPGLGECRITDGANSQIVKENEVVGIGSLTRMDELYKRTL